MKGLKLIIFYLNPLVSLTFQTRSDSFSPVRMSLTRYSSAFPIPAFRKLRVVWATWQDLSQKNKGQEGSLVLEHLPSMSGALDSSRGGQHYKEN
jgi:hypothetical protein